MVQLPPSTYSTDSNFATTFVKRDDFFNLNDCHYDCRAHACNADITVDNSCCLGLDILNRYLVFWEAVRKR